MSYSEPELIPIFLAQGKREYLGIFIWCSKEFGTSCKNSEAHRDKNLALNEVSLKSVVTNLDDNSATFSWTPGFGS